MRQLKSAEAVALFLEKREEHKYVLAFGKPPIDHPGIAPHSSTTANPAQFPKSTTTWNHWSGTGRGDQRRMECPVLFIGQHLEDTLRENRGLNDDYPRDTPLAYSVATADQ